jgi:hypothetical protein
MWGVGTERFANPQNGVYGHGFRRENGLPFDGDGLFVIPDLLGGGIKIKTGDALADGRAFITTPFGMEGYEPAHDPNVLTADFESWPAVTTSYFKQIGATSEGVT